MSRLMPSTLPAAEAEEEDFPFVDDDGATAAGPVEDFPFLDGVHSASDFRRGEFDMI